MTALKAAAVAFIFAFVLIGGLFLVISLTYWLQNPLPMVIGIPLVLAALAGVGVKMFNWIDS